MKQYDSCINCGGCIEWGHMVCVRESEYSKNRDVTLSKKQKSLLEKIQEGIPDDGCYSLNVMWVSVTGWRERIITDRFIEDYFDMSLSDYPDMLLKKHPDDYVWRLHSEAFEFGNGCDSSPVPDNIHTLIQEIGLDDFLALPEVRLIDSNSFEFEIME